MQHPRYRVVGIGKDGVQVIAAQGVSLRRARHVRVLLQWDRVFGKVFIERDVVGVGGDDTPVTGMKP